MSMWPSVAKAGFVEELERFDVAGDRADAEVPNAARARLVDDVFEQLASDAPRAQPLR